MIFFNKSAIFSVLILTGYNGLYLQDLSLGMLGLKDIVRENKSTAFTPG
jgi:hypothetical protein